MIAEHASPGCLTAVCLGVQLYAHHEGGTIAQLYVEHERKCAHAQSQGPRTCQSKRAMRRFVVRLSSSAEHSGSGGGGSASGGGGSS